MKQKFLLIPAVIAASLFFFPGCKKNPTPNCDGGKTIVTTTKVFATGLNNPRGLKFGPDGYLYVAEGGLGGTNSSEGLCMQVTPPVGPVLGSTTSGRISKISSSGVRTTITDQLPSSVIAPSGGGFISGVSDVAFIGHDMYALLGGAGCSHGVPSVPNAVIKVSNNGAWSVVSNLSEYTMTHETAHPEPHGGAEPDGTPYSMINV
ncbi:MAG: ScyD/ScyE family protein, partial [Ginsengibacter sp.]